MVKKTLDINKQSFILLMLMTVLFQNCKQRQAVDHSLSIYRIKSSMNSFYSNSHIIEGENSLVVIDVHMDEEDVNALTKSIKRLEKPLEAIVITHRHPDHMNGLAFISSKFPKAQILAGPKTTDAIRLNAPSWDISLNRIKIFAEGKIRLAERQFEVAFFDSSESPESVVLYDVKSKSLFTGDLVLQGQHLWLVERQLDNWLSNLEKLKERYKIETVYPGHGVKGGSELMDYTTDYINHFQEILNMGFSYDDAKTKMINRYPKHEFPSALEFSLGAFGLLPN